MPQRDARFIVLEGLDGAGTTTQAARLQAHLTQHGRPSFLTNEPTPEPVGAFIRRLLTHQERDADGAPYHPGERTMGLLFAADRLAHSRVIEARLRAGEHVVCDRYILSSMAYQTLEPSITGEWVIDVNRGCARPDLTLFLAVPVEVGFARVTARRGSVSVYETRAQLEKVARNYEQLMPMYEASFGPVIRVDGTKSVDDVHAAVVAAIDAR
jgi:dTMP kinase